MLDHQITNITINSDATALSPLAYSVAEAVQTSGIGRTTLYRLMGSRELPSVKIGSRTLIRRIDLEDLLERHVCKRAA